MSSQNENTGTNSIKDSVQLRIDLHGMVKRLWHALKNENLNETAEIASRCVEELSRLSGIGNYEVEPLGVCPKCHKVDRLMYGIGTTYLCCLDHGLSWAIQSQARPYAMEEGAPDMRVDHFVLSHCTIVESVALLRDIDKIGQGEEMAQDDEPFFLDG